MHLCKPKVRSVLPVSSSHMSGMAGHDSSSVWWDAMVLTHHHPPHLPTPAKADGKLELVEMVRCRGGCVGNRTFQAALESSDWV